MSKNKTKTKPDAFSVVLWSVLAGVFALLFVVMTIRSEERRVGKECRL